MIAAARARLQYLLANEPEFVAEIAALGLAADDSHVVPGVRSGNRPLAQLHQSEYPCWIDDAGEQVGAGYGNVGSDPAGLVINSTQQDWQGDIELSLVWHQQDHAKSVAQTDAILPALVRLLLRHPDLDDTCALAWVASADSSLGERHPTHVVHVVIRCVYTIERDAP
ncbi:hypothetical protein EIM50_13755 [Pseudoxanthomonas sp. SGD-10]|nr:hypothetical protein EIM50_13755 [Pseudoxanthomonas sp. SGD-10]